MVVDEDDGKHKRCRLVLVPEFSKTGILALVNLRTLRVKTLRFRGEGMAGGTGSSDDGKPCLSTTCYALTYPSMNSSFTVVSALEHKPLVEPASSVPHSSNNSGLF